MLALLCLSDKQRHVYFLTGLGSDYTMLHGDFNRARESIFAWFYVAFSTELIDSMGYLRVSYVLFDGFIQNLGPTISHPNPSE